MAGRFSVDTVFRAIDQISAPMRRMQTRATEMFKGISKQADEMNRHMSATLGTMRSVATGVAVVGTAAGAGLLWAGKAGAEFEQAIAKVGAVSLLSRDQIADLEAKALELGRTTKFTATEAANAMEVMGRAGFKNSEILSGIGGILNAAAAEGAEMAEVTSHVSNVLKGMGLEASQAGRVADVLALASARTNSSISSLGESMKNLSPVARQFGVGLEEAVGMVALLQDVGLDASEAGTATATMLTKLTKPTDDVAAKMKSMGVAFKDAKGNMLPPLQVFQNMMKASDKLGGNMDKVAFFADLVGLRGQKAALNLQSLFTSDKGQKLVEELMNANGSAEKMATLSMDNLLGDLTLLESAVDGVKVALYNTESGGLRNVVKGITDWVTANQALIVGGFTEFMASLRDNLPTIIKWLERFGKILVVFLTFATAVKAANAALVIFNALMAANPWVLLIYAIVAAVALIWAFWSEIKAFFVAIWDAAKAFGAAVVKFFAGVWDAMKAPLIGYLKFCIGIWTVLLQPAVIFFKGLWAIGQWAWSQLLSLFQMAAPYFLSIWNAITGAFGVAWDAIAGIARSAYEVIVGIFTPIVDVLGAIWDGVRSGFAAVFDWISSKVGWLVEKATWLVDKLQGIGGDALGGDVDLINAGGAGRDMIAPRSTSTSSESTTRTEVTVKPAAGATASQTRGPRRSPGLRLEPTGAF
jgi:TP901 family phage tail tape measure protein